MSYCVGNIKPACRFSNHTLENCCADFNADVSAVTLSSSVVSDVTLSPLFLVIFVLPVGPVLSMEPLEMLIVISLHSPFFLEDVLFLSYLEFVDIVPPGFNPS